MGGVIRQVSQMSVLEYSPIAEILGAFPLANEAPHGGIDGGTRQGPGEGRGGMCDEELGRWHAQATSSGIAPSMWPQP